MRITNTILIGLLTIFLTWASALAVSPEGAKLQKNQIEEEEPCPKRAGPRRRCLKARKKRADKKAAAEKAAAEKAAAEKAATEKAATEKAAADKAAAEKAAADKLAAEKAAKKPLTRAQKAAAKRKAAAAAKAQKKAEKAAAKKAAKEKKAAAKKAAKEERAQKKAEKAAAKKAAKEKKAAAKKATKEERARKKAEKAAAGKAAADKLAAEKAAAGKLAADKADKDKAAADKLAAEKAATEKAAADKLAADKAAKEKAAAEKAAADKLAADKAAKEKAAAEKAAADKLAAEKAVPDKSSVEKAVTEKKTPQKTAAEKRSERRARKRAEKAAKRKAAAEAKARKKAERVAAKKAKKEERARKKAEKVAAKKAAKKAAAEKAAADKLAAEKAATEKAAADKLAVEKAATEKAAADKLAAEKTATEKAAADKLAKEKAAAEKAAADKLAAEKAADKAAADKLAAEKAAADKAAADMLAAEKAAAKRAAAEKRAQDRAQEKAARAAKRKAKAEARVQRRAEKAAARKEAKRKRAEDKARRRAEAHATALANATAVIVQVLQPQPDAVIVAQLRKHSRPIVLEALHNSLTHSDERVRRIACTALNTFRDAAAVPLLVKRLEDPSPLVVMAATRTLGDTLQKNAIRMISNLVGHSSVQVRCEAAETLASINTKSAKSTLQDWRTRNLSAEERSCVLGALMTTGDTTTLAEAIDLVFLPGGSELATHVLRRGGIAALPPLAERLAIKAPALLLNLALSIAALNGNGGVSWMAHRVSSKHAHVRQAALRWLLDRASEKNVIRLLLKTTRKTDSGARAQILRELAIRKVPTVLPLARKWLNHSDPALRTACAIVFREMPHKRDAGQLIRQMQTERLGMTPQTLPVRVAILEALSKHRSPHLVALFVNATGYPGEQKVATDALVQIGEPALRTLLLALKVGDEKRTPFIAEVLARIGEGIGPTVAELLRHRRESVRILARELLTASGDPDAVAFLVKQLNDKNFKEPLVVIEALSAFSTPAAVAALLEAARHPDMTLRVAALRALGKTHSRSDKTFEELTLIAEEDTEVLVRAEAIHVMFQLGATDLFKLLGRLIQYDDRVVRTASYKAFARMGNPAGVAPLARQLSNVHGTERMEVRKVLRRLTRNPKLRSRSDYEAWHTNWSRTEARAIQGFKKGTFTVNEQELSYRVAGTGPTIIAISGRRGGSFWANTLRHLASGHRVVLYDAPGRAGTAGGSHAFTLSSELAIIEALQKHVKATTAVLLADEVGALLAAQYAIAQPQAVQTLVLVTPTLAGSRSARDAIAAQRLPKTIRRDLGNLDAQFAWFHPAAWVRYRNAVLNTGYVKQKTLAPRLEAFPVDPYVDQQLARMMGRLQLADQLEQLTTDVLIVRGEQDALASSEIQALAKITRDHAHVSLVSIKGVGHYPQLESPKKLAQAIRPVVRPKTTK